jgi:hypothetical protein
MWTNKAPDEEFPKMADVEMEWCGKCNQNVRKKCRTAFQAAGCPNFQNNILD